MKTHSFITGVVLMRNIQMKLVSILLSTVLAGGIFSGCTAADKLSLVNSMEKMLQIKSMISKSDVRIRVGVTGLPDEYEEMVGSMLPFNKDIYMRVYQKVNEEEGGVANSQMEATFQVGKRNVNTTVWTRADASGNEPATQQIIRVPSELKGFLPPELTDKEYMVLDDTGINGGENMNPDEYREIAEAVSKFQVNLITFLKEYALHYDPNFAFITDKGESIVNGRPLKLYEIRLSDQSLKGLLRYTVNDLLKNESAKQLMKDLLISMVAMSGEAAAGEELEAVAENLRDGTESFSEELNKMLEAFDSIRLLGDRGIVMNLGIDEDGYIVKQSGYADFIFNMQEFEKAFRMSDGYNGDNIEGDLLSPEAVFTMNLDFDFELSNINEDIDIEFPELTSDNSFNLTEELVKLGMIPDGTEEQESPTGIILDNEWMDFTPIVMGDVVLVPVEDMATRLGAQVVKENGVLTLTKNGRRASFPMDDMVAVVDGVEQTLDYPVIALEDKTYVPLDAIAGILNVNVSRNEFGNVVIDRK
jgi:hypothetical protein